MTRKGGWQKIAEWGGRVWPIVGIFFFLGTALIGKTGSGWLLVFIILGAILEVLLAFRKEAQIGPYRLMVLAPLLCLRYLSVRDFQIRLACFFLLAYVVAWACSGNRAKLPFSLSTKSWLTIWLLAFTLFGLVAIFLYGQGIHLSGDEPHYLMIAQSIVDDGDFDLKNNFEQKTYHRYLPVDIRFHGGEVAGKYRSFHMPGQAFLLVPFYWLFRGIGFALPPQLFFRLVAALYSAFFALVFFQLLRLHFPSQDMTGFWLFSLLTFPLAFHAVHLFPDLPAAALLAAGYVLVFSEKKRYLLAGLCFSAIPWFHVKYYPALIVFALVVGWRLFRERNAAAVWRFFLFPLLSWLLLLFFCRQVYGTFNPANIFPSASYWSTPWLLRAKVFLAYFLDQRDGLLFYAPLFFLLLFGWRRQWRQQALLLGLAAAYVGFHALTTVRGAYSPAGRPLIFVIWIFLLWLARVLESHDTPAWNFAMRLLAGLQVFVTCWLLYHPLFVYQPVTGATRDGASALWAFLGGNFLRLTDLLPSFLTAPPVPHPANFFWLLLLALIVILFYGPWRLKPLLTRIPPILPWGIFVFLTFLLCFFPHLTIAERDRVDAGPYSLFAASRNFVFLPQARMFRIKADATYDILFETRAQSQGALTLHFLNAGEAEVLLRHRGQVLFRLQRAAEGTCRLRLAALNPLSCQGRRLLPLEISVRSRQRDLFVFLKLE